MPITSTIRMDMGLLAALLFISSCEKDFAIETTFLDNPQGMLASGSTADSVYTKVLWMDDFNGFGTSSQTDESCYSDDAKATCSRRLDWFHQSPTCSESVAHLKKLDKCTWTIWDGYSWGGGSKKVAYKPSGIKVVEKFQDDERTGILVLQPRIRPDSEGPFQCGPPEKVLSNLRNRVPYTLRELEPIGGFPTKSETFREPLSDGDPFSDNWYDINCKIIVGAIDSKARQNDHTPGMNIKDGRLEVVARWPDIPGVGNALWMWRGNEGTGNPYIDRGHEDDDESEQDYVGEIDIMESKPKGTGLKNRSIFQTYHVWTSSDHASSGGKSTKFDFTKWHTYGVERTGNQLSFIVDGTYTRTITEKSTDSKNLRTMRIDNIPEFLMIGMGPLDEAATNNWPSLNSNYFLVDKVTFFVKP